MGVSAAAPALLGVTRSDWASPVRSAAASRTRVEGVARTPARTQSERRGASAAGWVGCGRPGCELSRRVGSGGYSSWYSRQAVLRETGERLARRTGRFPQLVDPRSSVNGLLLKGSPGFREEDSKSGGNPAVTPTFAFRMKRPGRHVTAVNRERPATALNNIWPRRKPAVSTTKSLRRFQSADGSAFAAAVAQAHRFSAGPSSDHTWRGIGRFAEHVH
jgi:hypothetical protein